MPDAEAVRTVLDPQTIPQFELSRQHNYSLFADREHTLLGQPFSKHFQVGPDCRGTIEERREVHTHYPGLYLKGTKPMVGRQILVTSNGNIVGLGFTKLHVPNSWTADARPVSGVISVYAIKARGSACRISTM